MTALLLACGALAREVIALRDRHRWDAEVQALSAGLHNRPKDIPAALQRRMDQVEREFDPVIVVYGDCGTGGELKKLLVERGWEGLAAPHCYALYADERRFERMMQEEPGTFFLTDYLVASFDHLVIESLGLDRHPELLETYFGRYQRVVYLQQRRDPRLRQQARRAAERLELPLEVQFTGLDSLESALLNLIQKHSVPVEMTGHQGPRADRVNGRSPT